MVIPLHTKELQNLIRVSLNDVNKTVVGLGGYLVYMKIDRWGVKKWEYVSF